MVMRVVFLDIDGVLATTRAALAYGDYGVIRRLDPTGIEFLNRLYEAAPYWVVVTSTWRNEVNMQILLQSAGLHAPCHEDWRTSSDIVEGAKDSRSDRPYQINQWLNEHGVDPMSSEIPIQYIILDDDSFDWTEYQRPRVVQPDPHNGISLENMYACLKLFDVRWPQRNRPFPKKLKGKDCYYNDILQQRDQQAFCCGKHPCEYASLKDGKNLNSLIL